MVYSEQLYSTQMVIVLCFLTINFNVLKASMMGKKSAGNLLGKSILIQITNPAQHLKAYLLK